MQALLNIDYGLFDFIAVTLKNGLFDAVMPVLSDARYWRIPLVLLAVSLVVFGRRRGAAALGLCLLAVGLSDFLCGSVLRPLIARPRPLGGVTHSFPSCHSANMFAAATVFSMLWHRTWVRAAAFGVAAAVGYSRVYTTSHYPSDVAAGAFIGAALALSVVLISRRLSARTRKAPAAT